LSIAIQEKNYFTDNPRGIFIKSIIFHAEDVNYFPTRPFGFPGMLE
jgi:hypothetical protein